MNNLQCSKVAKTPVNFKKFIRKTTEIVIPGKLNIYADKMFTDKW